MTKSTTAEGLYDAIDRLIAKLRAKGHAALADSLLQRVRQTASEADSMRTRKLASFLEETMRSRPFDFGLELQQDIRDILLMAGPDR